MSESEPGRIDFAGPNRRYWQLMDGAGRGLLGEALTDDAVVEYTDGLWRVLAPGEPVTMAVRQMMAAYVGRTLDWQVRRSIFWRLAAAFDRLLDNEKVDTQFTQTAPYWTGLRVLDAWYSRPSREGKSMVDVSMFVYGGPFAGLDFTQRVPWRWLMRVLAWDVGFTRFKRVHIGELVQARLIGLLDTSEVGRPKLAEYRGKAGIKAFNRGLRKDRQFCRLGLAGHECWSCWMGYAYEPGVMDPCMKAAHSRRWVQRPCKACGHDGWFDPGYDTFTCLRCVARDNDLRQRIGG